MKRALTAAAVVLALGAAGGGCGCGGPPRPSYPREPVRVVLPAIDGGNVDFASLRGTPVAVQFFTTWSVAAMSDVEELRRAREKTGGRLEIVSVGLDPNGAVLIFPWRDEVRADWWVATSTPETIAGTLFGQIEFIPTTFVLDAAGRIVWRHEGQLPPGRLAGVVQSLVRQGGAP